MLPTKLLDWSSYRLNQLSLFWNQRLESKAILIEWFSRILDTNYYNPEQNVPIVQGWSSSKSSSVNRSKMEDLPTPESPIIKILNKWSYSLSSRCIVYVSIVWNIRKQSLVWVFFGGGLLLKEKERCERYQAERWQNEVLWRGKQGDITGWSTCGFCCTMLEIEKRAWRWSIIESKPKQK